VQQKLRRGVVAARSMLSFGDRTWLMLRANHDNADRRGWNQFRDNQVDQRSSARDHAIQLAAAVRKRSPSARSGHTSRKSRIWTRSMVRDSVMAHARALLLPVTPTWHGHRDRQHRRQL
jgi:hypothetical protein